MKRVTLGVFIGAGLAVALALAFFISPFASSQPDGLNKVAIDQGFDQSQRSSAVENSPTAGYAVKGLGDGPLSTGVAGLLGVTVTFSLGLGLFVLVRRARGNDPAPQRSAERT
jgi:cobalt/nickel transport system permease protein